MTSLQKTKILIVDDRLENLIALEKVLSSLDAKFIRATSGVEALTQVLENDFSLILLDVQMPVMNGFETAELIRGNEDTKHIPIIFITAISKEQKHVFKGYYSGAVDYLFKPLEPEILKSKVGVFIELSKQKAIIEKNSADLSEANLKILEQQKSIIQQERLKVMMQMSGNSCNELNQPLMTLMGSVEIMRLENNLPVQWERHINRIGEAVNRISGIVKKMNNIYHFDTAMASEKNMGFVLNEQINILLVDDSERDLQLISSYLSNQKHITLANAPNSAKAMQALTEGAFDLILMEYKLVGANGIDFLQWIRAKGITIPAIVITRHGDENIARRIIKAGACDYLSKTSLNPKQLLESIGCCIEAYRFKREIAQATTKIQHMAIRDDLTGLYNRRHMNEVLKQEFKRAKRYGTELACLLLDLDYFKEVNDTYGHGFGDFVLQRFSARLSRNIRGADFCFRYGGEEFLVLLPHTNIDGAKNVAKKIRQLCENKPYNNGFQETTITVSIGITSIKHRMPARVENLLTHADRALYQAKAQGRNRYKVYLENFSASPDENSREINYSYLKKILKQVLEKTANAALDSLRPLLNDMGGDFFKEHNARVLEYIAMIGSKLDLNPMDIETVQCAAVIHDFTKILLPKTLYKNKQLTAAEIAQVKEHPLLLADISEQFDLLANEKKVLMHHHERYDGTGYPDGLKGEQIPFCARILAIADAVVAMTSERPYREILSGQQVIDELVNNAGKQFDPKLTMLFLDLIKEKNLFGISDRVIAQGKARLTDTADFS
ncbi:MAG: diguanylate cyclase [Desulfobacteraceae bacterium]|nr:diguanylate cyclase [Desulfobacteraceae bacterium]